MAEPRKAVFLSYASQDAEAARRIADALRGAGIEVWLDQSELKGGDAWDRQIRKQIHDCGLFIPVISASTQRRPEGYFRLEWKLAVERTHLMSERVAFLVPVVIGDASDDEADVPEAFRAVQWTRLPGGAPSSAFVERVARLLAPGQSCAAPAVRKAGPGAVTRSPPRARTLALLAVALAVVGIFVADRFLLSRHHADAGPAALTASTSSAIPDKSIAVLPFVDMSEKKDQEYFSDGLSEELIDNLARTADLRVIARTSSFQFKGRNEDVRTIAAKLGVTNLLEGSVRTAGHAVRISAQLLRATDGAHLWSQTYDRHMSDIFKVQSEIANEVVQALNATLAGAPADRSEPTRNTGAHELLLKGEFFYNRSSVGDLNRAIEQFMQALALDPSYSLAWAKLGRVYIIQGQIGELGSLEAQAKARDALGHAIALDPNSVVAHRWLGRLYAQFDYDLPAARKEFDKAIALDPNGPEGIRAHQDLLIETAFRSGQFDETIRVARQGLVNNPLDATAVWVLGGMQYYGGLKQDALVTRLRVIELAPSYSGAQADVTFSWLQLGKVTDALDAAARETDEPSRLLALSCAYQAAGRNTESEAAVRQLEGKFAGINAVLIALAHSCRGNREATFKWLDRAYRQRESQMITIKVEPLLASLRNDPRYQALLRRVNLSD